MRSASYGRAILLTLLSWALACAQQMPLKVAASGPPQKTLSVSCERDEKPKRVLSPVSLSEDGHWRAYVEVDMQGERTCLYTTRLWVAQANEPYRMVYLMPPNRVAVANGMEILGWAKRSRMLLVKTEEWQLGSDAPSRQRVLGVDAETGMIYEPELEAIIQAHKSQRCSLRVIHAGFAADKNVDILVRGQLSTTVEGEETEADVPAVQRCGNSEEAWSFNYATGETKRVANGQPMQLVNRLLPR